MSKIFINLTEFEAGQQYDIWDKCSNEDFYEKYLLKYTNGELINYGNKLWFQALISMIDTPENELFFNDFSKTPEEINEEFDMIISPQANMFAHSFVKNFERNINFYKNIKIPSYIIACGAQGETVDDIDNLVATIGKESKAFIEAIYATGGEFALRGDITKMFFDKVCTNTAVVTGCPSIYQRGRNLHFSNDKVDEKDFRPVYNGIVGLKECYKDDESIFIGQDQMFEQLYNSNFGNTIEQKEIKALINIFGYDAIKLLFANRVKLFVSLNEWYNFLKSGFNFSYGSRIHGSIMPILAGVPALVYPIDTRVVEMANFYDIPLSDPKSKKSIYQQYLEMDYSKFNQTFPKKFDDFERFLQSHNIVNKINQENKFLYDKEYSFDNINKDNLEKLYSELVNKNKYRNYDMIKSLVRKLRK